MPTFRDLFHQHVAASLDKQLQLNDLLQSWGIYSCNMQEGKFLLAGNPSAADIVFDIQVLGSEVSGNQWVWSWASPAGDFPAELLETAQRLQRVGEGNGIREFTEPSFPINYEDPNNYITGSSIAAVGCLMFDGVAYIPMPYGDGNVFIVCSTRAPMPQIPNPIVRICTVFPQLMADWVIPDPKLAFQGYAAYYSLQTKIDGNVIHATHANFGSVTAIFDNLNRLTEITATAAGEKKPTGGLANKFLKKG